MTTMSDFSKIKKAAEDRILTMRDVMAHVRNPKVVEVDDNMLNGIWEQIENM